MEETLLVNTRYIIQRKNDKKDVGDITCLEITDTCYRLYQNTMRKEMLFTKAHFHETYIILETLSKSNIGKEVVL